MRWALLALVACSGPTKTTTPPPPPAPDAAVAAVDAPGPSEQEKLAAIQKAMNELDEAAQACWAAAATERFDIEGNVEILVDIAATSATTQVMRDTTRNPKLLGCLAELLAKYRWAPPLHGQAIQLPFKFRAPRAQYTVDRSLVPWNGQGKVSVAVLLDENNTGTGAASLVELAVQRGGSTGMRIAERAELWYFLHPATVQLGTKATPVAAGDMLYVPALAAREVRATAGDVHAVIAIVPGGREGSARAGALPTRELAGNKPAGTPVLLPAAKAKPYGRATIYAEPATIKDTVFAASVLELPAGANILEHAHAKETEVLYVLGGAGTMTVEGVTVPITSTSVIKIPTNTKHAFTATADVRAVQFYTPAGPEQRFKATK